MCPVKQARFWSRTSWVTYHETFVKRLLAVRPKTAAIGKKRKKTKKNGNYTAFCITSKHNE